VNEIDSLRIYTRIDELPEDLLDILAYDFKVDWYDYGYPISVKRDLIKNSVKVHMMMGTKFAVETGIRSLYPNSELEEWFDMAGSIPFRHILIVQTLRLRRYIPIS
jgi:phage tail P2-like protein